MKIITGGQTGVDTGALLGAYDAGIEFSAVMPVNHRRETPAPDWLKECSECLPTSNYSSRTRWVARKSDGVLIIAPSLDSPGTQLTHELALGFSLPCWWYQPVNPKYPGISENMTGEMGAIGWWVKQLERQLGREATLMVAGPRGSKWPQGEDFARTVVLRAFV